MRVDKQPDIPATPAPVALPQPIGKIAVLVALVVASTALFIFTWAQLLAKGIDFTHPGSLLLIIGTLAAACLMICLVAISSLVITRAVLVIGMVILASASVFIFFRISLWSVIAMVILALGFFYSYREISVDAKTRIKVMSMRIVGAGARTTISIVILAISLLYYSFLVSGPDAAQKFSTSLVSSGSKAVSGVLKVYYKDKYQPAMTLDAFIGNISNIVGDIKFSSGQDKIDQAISQGFSQAQQQLVIQAREDFLKMMGIQAGGGETMESVVEKIVRKNLDKYVGSYMKFIPAILAFGLFLLLNAFNFIFASLIKLFSFVIFHILKGLKFITIQKTMVEAEKISL